MRLKKCAECARAIDESATSCEYCGHQEAEILPEPAFDDSQFDELFEPQTLPAAAPPTAETAAALDFAEPDSEADPPVPDVQQELHPQANSELDPPGPPTLLTSEGIEDVQPDPDTPGFLDGLEDRLDQEHAPLREQPAERVSLPTPMAVPPVSGIGTRELATGLLGIAAGGILIFALLSARGSASPEAAASTPAAKPAPLPASAPAVMPTWSSNRAAWVGNERNAVAFELAAVNSVAVWMRQVQPMLVVRCRASRPEVFVFTDSPARMEPQDGDHTVQIQFDGNPPATERWPDSAEHDALFAPDGAAFLERLVRAQRLQFGFSPHNSNAVVIDFAVAGLQPHLTSAARQCGWKKP